MNYTIRKNCIFCNNKLEKEYFKNDLKKSNGLYCVEKNYKNDIKIPYNIYICSKCNTLQNKYLVDLKLVYLYGHNEGIGDLYKSMHLNFSNLILKNNYIKNIIEVGGSVGTLAKYVTSNSNINYIIIEPNCNLEENKQITIYKKFIENCDRIIFDKCDTLVMSHILEHFYNPIDILNKLLLNTNIKSFYLCWPDLDYYINNNVLNLLTVEHTFYIDLDFLEKILLNKYNFKLESKEYFKNHSVFLYFKKKINIEKFSQQITNTDIEIKIKNFFEKIDWTINKINTIIDNNSNKKIYLWPCSIHNLFLLKYDNFKINNIEGFVDNSINKIGKRPCSCDKLCFSLTDTLKLKNIIIILNGGPFNYEIESLITENNIEYYII
jgi:hypothetical protein